MAVPVASFNMHVYVRGSGRNFPSDRKIGGFGYIAVGGGNLPATITRKEHEIHVLHRIGWETLPGGTPHP